MRKYKAYIQVNPTGKTCIEQYQRVKPGTLFSSEGQAFRAIEKAIKNESRDVRGIVMPAGHTLNLLRYPNGWKFVKTCLF